jgi:pimeloyl-ACP methyl ester carboxylesterase
MVDTARLQTHVLFSGPDEGVPVLFIHGNAASSTCWEEIMLKLPEGFRGVAPDLRGYGDTEDRLIDATRGMQDWVDDLVAFMDALDIEKAHLVGHSLGGAVSFALVPAVSDRFLSVTLINPSSPYGFGGTKDVQGTPCYDDFAGSGGGTVNPEFVKLLAAGDRTMDNPQASPRAVMTGFYWKPPFRPTREEEFLSSMLLEKVGEQKYPGDFVPSPNWPNVAPGKFGPINAISPKYAGDTVQRFVSSPAKPHVLWVRGDSDLIISDASFFDMGNLGRLGYVPGWPGEDIYPPQPMVGQVRYVLEQYKAHGGSYEEVVIEHTGHFPYVEKPEEFMIHFAKVLK